MFDENELIKEKLEAAEDIIDAHAALHNRLEAAEEKETRSQVSNAAIHAAVHVVWLCQHTLAPALTLALATALTPALAPALTLTLTIHSHSHTLESKELKTKISHAHSLIHYHTIALALTPALILALTLPSTRPSSLFCYISHDFLLQNSLCL